MSAGRRRRRAARATIIAAVVVPVAAAAAAAAGLGLTRAGGGSPTQPQLPPSTTEITRQTLVDTQTEDGTVSHGDSTALGARLAGTLTGLPAVNKVIERGAALYQVDDTPVLLLYGSLPAYRALSPGVQGADVKQFERNLYALGYRGFTVDDTYTAGTADAVKEWQDDKGMPETGTVPLGRVAYAAGPVRVDSHDAALGDPLQAGGAVLHYTSTGQVVSVQLDLADGRLAKQGAAVTITRPDGKTGTGKITGVAIVVVDSSSSSSSGSSTGDSGSSETMIAVTVTPAVANALSGLDEASVQVAFAAAKKENVLTVPVSALLALAEGGYGLQLVEGGSTRIVAVQTGMFAAGRVQVSGAELTEGAIVGVPA
jgi:hypothetical protein